MKFYKLRIFVERRTSYDDVDIIAGSVNIGELFLELQGGTLPASN